MCQSYEQNYELGGFSARMSYPDALLLKTLMKPLQFIYISMLTAQ